MDLVLLVNAADEGIIRRPERHMDILHLLVIKRVLLS